MAEISLGQQDAGGTRSARPGDLVRIHLEETPASGFRWQVEEFDQNVLEPAGDRFLPPPGVERGGRGRRELRFSVVGAGRGRVRLTLRRPWQGVEAAARRYETTIEAAPGS
ncbi:protease inhibitor I42 family protein [Micromonospora sp. NPDC049559]|uniref:protease inhibitor I42 family protein n=1 Tax=Micromonospora sp. NPDC049559 TaxID=3155923 RepID=UPI00343EC32A